MKRTDPRYKAKRRLSPAELDGMFRRQHGKCAICRAPVMQGDPVDHCHFTGKIRGVLCCKCNTGLGQFGDDPEKLWQAIKYLDSGFIAARLYDAARDATPGCQLVEYAEILAEWM